MNKAAKFTIEVYDPYPVMCLILYDGKQICRIPHTELNDLEYVLKKAIREAKAKLDKTSEYEVML